MRNELSFSSILCEISLHSYHILFSIKLHIQKCLVVNFKVKENWDHGNLTEIFIWQFISKMLQCNIVPSKLKVTRLNIYRVFTVCFTVSSSL